MPFLEDLRSGKIRAMQKEFRAPSEKIRFTGIQCSGALVFAGSFDKPPFILEGICEQSVNLSTIGRGAIQGRRIFGEGFLGAQNSIGAVPAKTCRIGDASHGELRLVGVFEGGWRTVAGRGCYGRLEKQDN